MSRISWDEGMVTALVSYHQAGMPLPKIAKEFGTTSKIIAARLYRVTHPTPRNTAPAPNAWTIRQKFIVRNGAFMGADIDEVCELLAEAGRSMAVKAVQDSRYYREGLRMKKAAEERLIRSRREEAERVLEAKVREAATQRPGTYRCPHFRSSHINLPVVKGYTPGVPA